MKMENRYLYKAKRSDNGKWIQGYLYGVWEHKYILWGMINNVPNMEEVDPSTICQCTGLKDKNGKLIWENDIVKAWSQGSRAIGEVRKRIDGLWFMYPAWQNQELWGLCPNNEGETTVEIVGNTFDNPKLLEGKTNDD